MLRVRIHKQKEGPSGFEQVWCKDLNGKNGEHADAKLLALQADPLMQGELVSLRFKDGEGSGCIASGSLLEIEYSETKDSMKQVDVYFFLDSWRSW